MKRAPIALIAALALVAANASAQESPDSISFGPIRTGMSLAELQAATPQLVWTESKSIESRYLKTYKAPGAFTLGGLAHDATVSPGWHGGYGIVLSHRAIQPNVDACLKITEGLIADIETRLGTFTATNNSYEAESAKYGKAKTTTRQAGTGSSYTWHVNASYAEASAVRTVPAGEMKLLGQYIFNSPLFGDSMCMTSLKIETPSHPPAREDIAAEKLELLIKPSIAVVNRSLKDLDLPPAGLTVTVQCKLARNSGMVGECDLDPNASTALKNGVFHLTEHSAFTTTLLNSGDPVPLYTKLTFRFDAKHRLKLGTPSDALTAADIQKRDERDVIKLPTILAGVRDKADYHYATAQVACQVQADDSLACLDVELQFPEGVVADAALTSSFNFKAEQHLLAQRVKLKNGDSAVGRWVTLKLPLETINSERLRQRIIDERRSRAAGE